MHVECGRCNAQGAQGAPSALGRQIFFPDEAILAKLHEAGLFVKPEKCEFEANKTTFLGFVISHLGIAMDPENVSAVLNWEVPKTIQVVQCFLGFANFYRRFIEGYLHICTPLFNLLKTVDKDQDASTDLTTAPPPAKEGANKSLMDWTPRCQEVFDELKAHFCFAPVLKHFDPTLETMLETDASDYVVSGILSQRHIDPAKPDSHGTLQPVAFLTEKMSPAECNYGIGDKELLAIITCLEKWHMYCKWGSGLLKSRLCFLTSKKHKQDYKQRGTTTWG